jgi:hypothetical protein
MTILFEGEISRFQENYGWLLINRFAISVVSLGRNCRVTGPGFAARYQAC